MKRLAVVLAFCLLPGATGQAYTAEDGQGDGFAQLGAGGPSSMPIAAYPDLASLAISEDSAGFQFVLALHPGGSGTNYAYALLGFSHGTQAYLVQYPPEEANVGGSGLYRVDGAGGRRFVMSLATVPEASTFTVNIPRDAVYDENGAVPGVGSQLKDLWAQVTGGQVTVGPSGTVYVFDAMPDDGATLQPYVGTLGIAQVGSARLTSDQPTRASNGESTTFVFSIAATNSGTKPGVYRIFWEGGPAAWDVTMARPVFELKAGETVQKHLLVTIPFAHQHGKFETMRVKMTTDEDPQALGQLDVGIRYHEVPQPAGHHNRLVLHSKSLTSGIPGYDLVVGGGSYAYMNTLGEDPEDESVPVLATSNSRPITEFTWDVRLAPSLDIGIAFQPSGGGVFRGAFSSNVPAAAATLEANLFVRQTDADGRLAEISLASGGPSTAMEMSPGQETLFELPLAAQSEDLPFLSGSEMFLRLRLVTGQPTAVSAQEIPQLEPGAYLDLDLLEYRDPIYNVEGLSRTLRIEPTTSATRQGNPGDQLLFSAMLNNTGQATEIASLALDGLNSGWARLIGAPRRTLGPGESALVHVAITIPANATGSDMADVILTAEASSGQGETLTRFLVLTDNERDYPDDAGQIAQLDEPTAQDAPALGFAALALVVMAFAQLRRR